MLQLMDYSINSSTGEPWFMDTPKKWIPRLCWCSKMYSINVTWYSRQFDQLPENGHYLFCIATTGSGKLQEQHKEIGKCHISSILGALKVSVAWESSVQHLPVKSSSEVVHVSSIQTNCLTITFIWWGCRSCIKHDCINVWAYKMHLWNADTPLIRTLFFWSVATL